jgi:asparagine synthetase B (glutamine-hydrolysing)
MTKVIIKEFAKKYFRDDFIYRPKEGFALPLNEWLRLKSGKKWIKENYETFENSSFAKLDTHEISKTIDAFLHSENDLFYEVYKLAN